MKPCNSAVIFDMDGVIIDTEPLYTKAEIRLFGEYGVKIPEEDWSRYTQEFEENKNWWKQYEKKFWEEYDSTTNQNVFYNLERSGFYPGYIKRLQTL